MSLRNKDKIKDKVNYFIKKADSLNIDNITYADYREFTSTETFYYDKKSAISNIIIYILAAIGIIGFGIFATIAWTKFCLYLIGVAVWPACGFLGEFGVYKDLRKNIGIKAFKYFKDTNSYKRLKTVLAEFEKTDRFKKERDERLLIDENKIIVTEIEMVNSKLSQQNEKNLLTKLAEFLKLNETNKFVVKVVDEENAIVRTINDEDYFIEPLKPAATAYIVGGLIRKGNKITFVNNENNNLSNDM